MSKHYKHIRTIEQLQKEQVKLHQRIKLSEKLLIKEYVQIKQSFTLPGIVSNVASSVIGLTEKASVTSVIASLLSLALKKRKKKTDDEKEKE